MNRRIIGVGLLILLIAAAAIALLHRDRCNAQPSGLRSPAESQRATESFTPPPAQRQIPPARATQDTETAAQRITAEADLALVSVKGMLRDYRARFGENPIGTNLEITRALRGRNPGQAVFESIEAKIENGKLVDRWHHPYFFHQLSRSEMEIRSAGPDGELWTTDDEVLH